jgi:hypothetical protein
MSNLFGVFAGVDVVNLIMPTSNLANGNFADAYMWSSRGSTLASYALMNPNGAVKGSWDSTLSSAPQSDGGGCPNLGTTYTYGGGEGINGCGAHLSMSLDLDETLATADLDTTWQGLKTPGNGAGGNAFWVAAWYCNYNCNTYPFQK